ncbi:MAG: hypothetical protein WCA20_07345, partial [Candidatus Sulfotelmatobacter sp.]
FKDRNAVPSSQPKIAFQESKATAQLQPASQVAVAPFPSKLEPPFPEPVNPRASNSLPPRLWVVSNGGEVVEYDPSTFEVKQTVTIPADAIPSDAHTLRYFVDTNRKGQILVGPTSHGKSIESSTCTLWLWNGQSGSYLNCGNEHRQQTAPRPSLAADGEHLFWLVNEQQETPREFEKNIMPSMVTKFHIWETDFSGGQRQEIVSSAFPECVCSTGACEETCPTAGIWTPKSGMDHFFGVYGWYAGQLGQSHYVGEYLYRKSPDGQRSSAELPPSFENDILDAAEDASAFIILIPDSACCGWNNESDDQTLLLRKGQTIVLFDEFARYDNSQYDVNYSAREAQLSPDNQLVAMTISSSSRPGEEFRASNTAPQSDDTDADGSGETKVSPALVERINKTLADLPAVEVVTTTNPPKRAAYLPNATLVGWLSEREILIVKDSFLVAYDVSAGRSRKSNISVGDKGYAVLR